MGYQYHLGIIGSTEFNTLFQKLLHEKKIETFHSTIDDAINDNDIYLDCIKKSDSLIFEFVNNHFFFLIENALKLGKNIFINHAQLSVDNLIEADKISTEAKLICNVFQPDSYYLHIKNFIKKDAEHINLELNYPKSESQNISELFLNDIHTATRYITYYIKEDLRYVFAKKYPIYADAPDLILIFLEYKNGKSAVLKFSKIDEEKMTKINICAPYNHSQFEFTTYNLSIDKKVNEKIVNNITKEKIKEIIDSHNENKILRNTLLDYILSNTLSTSIIKSMV